MIWACCEQYSQPHSLTIASCRPMREHLTLSARLCFSTSSYVNGQERSHRMLSAAHISGCMIALEIAAHALDHCYERSGSSCTAA